MYKCLANSGPLLKTTEDNNGWVYVGKEVYGTKQIKNTAPPDPNLYYDALGRLYPKLPTNNYRYFSGYSKPKVFVAEEELDFDVWVKIITDFEGNEVSVFIKEDKQNGIKKDSTVYSNKSWNVFDFFESETQFKNSSGIKSVRKFDKNGRLLNRIIVNANGDTTNLDLYRWKNGRLIQTVTDGVTRNFIYGETLQDTVKVIPSDKNFNERIGYDGSVGKIPEEGTLQYEIFVRNPYGNMIWGKRNNDEKSVSNNILERKVSYSCVAEDSDMPKTSCVRFERGDFSDTQKNREQGNYGYPGDKDLVFYGISDFDPLLFSECGCNNFERYQPYFSGDIINEAIVVMQSTWMYNSSNNWHERCWLKGDMQKTYRHEVQHIRNARQVLEYFINSTPIITYETKEECEKYRKEMDKYIMKKWDNWSDLEKEHGNLESPTYSGARNGYSCD